MKNFEIHSSKVRKHIVGFIKREIRKRGFSKAVIGLSGGIDSTVLAYLTVEALGAKNVLGLWLPYYEEESEDDFALVKEIGKKLNIKIRKVKIAGAVDKLVSLVGCSQDKIRKGNIMARTRMIILYDYSRSFNALVLGTSNRTETLLGYGTIWGDTACALAPLGGLYKSQIYSLADYLGVSRLIIDKTPTAGLWRGQRDEDELGFTYKEVDSLLYFMIDRNYSPRQLENKGFSPQFIRRVKETIKKSAFKSQMPAVPKIF